MDSNHRSPKRGDLQSPAIAAMRTTQICQYSPDSRTTDSTQPKGQPAGVALSRSLPCYGYFPKLVAGPGIEPGTGAYETPVLPLHYPAIKWWR